MNIYVKFGCFFLTIFQPNIHFNQKSTLHFMHFMSDEYTYHRKRKNIETYVCLKLKIRGLRALNRAFFSEGRSLGRNLEPTESKQT